MGDLKDVMAMPDEQPLRSYFAKSEKFQVSESKFVFSDELDVVGGSYPD
jgi:hypothetical protein